MQVELRKEICEDHVYECSELSGRSIACLYKILQLECYYDSVDEGCKAYGECTSAKTSNECSPINCSYSNTEGCQDSNSSLNCDGTDKNSCKAWDNEYACSINENYECAKHDRIFQSCSDYENGFMNECEQACKIDETNKCVQKTCSDFVSYDSCTYILNLLDFTSTPCIWSNSSCKEATDQELQDMGVMCQYVTSQNYKWDEDSGKCSACESVEDNPLYSFLKEFSDKLKSSIIWDVILITSLILN